MNLSSALEDYLETILALEEKEGSVRISDIAIYHDVAKSSVSEVINRLTRLNLVKQERYGPVNLTVEGRKYASNIRTNHRLLRTFLVDVLGVDDRIAEQDACQMEHAVSPATMEKLLSFLKHGEHVIHKKNDIISESDDEII